MPGHILDTKIDTEKSKKPQTENQLNAKRKYIGTIDGEDFYLRVVTSGEEAKKYPEVIDAMLKLEDDALTEQQKIIDKSGQKRTVKDLNFSWGKEMMRNYYDKEKGWFFKSSFNTNNQAMFVVENEAGKFASMMLVNFNDKSLRKDFHIPEEIKTFVFFDSIVTAEEYRGKGLFATAFDKLMTMVTNPKRGLEAPFQFMVSVMAANAIESDGAEFNYALNLPAYAAMWNERFTDNALQNRWVKTINGKGNRTITGAERLAISNFTQDGSDRFAIDESKIDELLKGQKEIAKTVSNSAATYPSRGVFLSGNIQDSAAKQVKQKRKDLLQNRRIEKHESKSKRPWASVITSENEEKDGEKTR